MPTAGVPRVHRASNVSDAVPRRIARARIDTVRVQSIYRSVLNIATTDGVLTVASPDAGGLPNGIMADLGPDWREIGLRPGMVVDASPTRIRVPDARLEISLEAAPRWSPRLRSADQDAGEAAARWRGHRATARTIAQARGTAGGLGALLREDGTDDVGVWTANVARRIVADLVVALEAGDPTAAADAATGLIGLGPGLTPSGDDVLVGVEAALHALGSPSAGFLALAVGDVEDRTTELAATLLRHAAAGEFAERLHTLLGALLASNDDGIGAAVDRAVAWGATSGTDCLVGVLVGLDVAAGVRRALS